MMKRLRALVTCFAGLSAVARGHFEVLETGPFVPLQSPELPRPLLRTFLEATGR